MNFWDTRTELEKTLLLILCVTIPVNGILLYMYSYFMKHYPKSGSEIPSDFGPKYGIDIPPAYSLIGSISKKSAENEDELVFQCPVYLLSENLILTDIGCMKEGDIVRISSKFWFKGGFKRQIIKTYINKILKFHVGRLDEPIVIDNRFTNVIRLNTVYDKTKKKVEYDTYRWNATFTNDDDDAEKYNKLEKLSFSLSKCTRQYDGFCTIESKENVIDDLNYYLKRREPIFEKSCTTLIGWEHTREDNGPTIEHFYKPMVRDDLKKYYELD